MKHLALLVGLLAVVVACSTAASPVVPGGSAASASPDAPSPSAAIFFNADNDGLKLVASFDRLIVEPGGDVTVQLSLNNTRSEEVVFREPCYEDAMIVEVPNPVEPIGREWDGMAGSFKTHALEESQGSPIESSIREPLKTTVKASPCHAPWQGELGFELQTIPAGDTYESTLTWSAELVKDLPAGPGDMPFSIEVQHDHEAVGGGMFKAETLAVNGSITVLPGGPKAVTAGEALDAALGDSEFAEWLSKQPRNSWVNTNLLLEPPAVGVTALPVVPYWHISLHREPRNWAALYIDALKGTILIRDFCDIPCNS